MKMKAYCPLEKIMTILEGKWTVLILWHLRIGPLRFSELQRKITGVTQKVLTTQLRKLEQYELIHREVYPEIPPKVVYSLSDSGKTIIPILINLNEWSRDHIQTEPTPEGKNIP